MSEQVQQQSRIKDLIARGKEQGYLTYAEVNDHLPEDISEPDQVEDIIQMINDMGIQVFEEAPDQDQVLMEEGDATADEIAAAEAAAAAADGRGEGERGAARRRESQRSYRIAAADARGEGKGAEWRGAKRGEAGATRRGGTKVMVLSSAAPSEARCAQRSAAARRPPKTP